MPKLSIDSRSRGIRCLASPPPGSDARALPRMVAAPSDPTCWIGGHPPSHVAEALALELPVLAGVSAVRIRVSLSRTTAVAWSAHPSDGGGAGMVTVGTVGGGPVGCGPGSGLSQVTQSKSPTPATRTNILIKVRSASGYFRLLGWCVGSLPFGCDSILRR